MSWITKLTRCKVDGDGAETVECSTSHGSMYGTYNPSNDILSEARELGYDSVEMSTKQDNHNDTGTLLAKTADGKYVWRTKTVPYI